MSAIFGIYHSQGQSVCPQAFAAMQADMAHRGPDRQAVWQEESIAMGHLLLAITPEAQYEPAPYPLEHIVVTAYARLDGREALMDALEVVAAERQRITDTELIARAWLRWERKMLDEIIGDFAFVVWDKQAKSLFCARDHVGVKPFLYVWKDGRFAWATEMKALVKRDFVGKNLSRRYQIDKIIGFSSDLSRTIWEDVKRLPPAHWLEIKDGQLEVQRYWSSSQAKPVRFEKPEDYVLAFRALLEQAVADRLRTEQPVGSSLSGGLDSSALTCIAAQQLARQQRRLVAVSSVLPEGYEGEATDERVYIEAVVEQETNIQIHYEDGEGLPRLGQLEQTFDHQFQLVNSLFFMDEAIAAQMAAQGVRRCITGYFGDMVASSYAVRPALYLLLGGEIGRMWRYLLNRKHASAWGWVKLLWKEIIQPGLPYRTKEKIRKFFRKKQLLDWDAISIRWEPKESSMVEKQSVELLYGKDRLQYHSKMLPDTEDHFAEEWDCLYAQYKIELTSPLTDKRILDFILGMPPEMHVLQGIYRGFFRQSIAAYVPKNIAERSDKKPFVPLYYTKFMQDLLHWKKELLSGTKAQAPVDSMLNYDKIIREIPDKLPEILPLQQGIKASNNISYHYGAYMQDRFFTWSEFYKNK